MKLAKDSFSNIDLILKKQAKRKKVVPESASFARAFVNIPVNNWVGSNYVIPAIVNINEEAINTSPGSIIHETRTNTDNLTRRIGYRTPASITPPTGMVSPLIQDQERNLRSQLAYARQANEVNEIRYLEDQINVLMATIRENQIAFGAHNIITDPQVPEGNVYLQPTELSQAQGFFYDHVSNEWIPNEEQVSYTAVSPLDDHREHIRQHTHDLRNASSNQIQGLTAHIQEHIEAAITIDNPSPIAGRVELAQGLLNANLISNAEQYFQILNNGRLNEEE